MPPSPKLIGLGSALAQGDTRALTTFWQEVQRTGTPLVEPVAGSTDEMWVTFLWRSESLIPQTGPSVIGQIDVTTGPVEKREVFPLVRLADSDLWYRTFRLPDRARFSYLLAWPLAGARKGEPDGVQIDGVTYDIFPDAMNPKRYAVRWHDRALPIRTSYAEGPAASPEKSIAERPGVPRGRLETIEFAGRAPGQRRFVSVYTPPGQERGCERCDLLVLFDAAEFLTAVPTPTILDNLQADGAIGPVVAVFIGDSSSDDRAADLRPAPKLSAFLRTDLLPWLRERYRFTRDPRRMVIAGSSLGGLAASYAAFGNSDLFGNAISLSGAHWWWPGFNAGSDITKLLNSESGWLTHEYAKSARLPLRFYVDVGTWEGAVMLLPNRAFRDVLEARGYDVEYREFVGGHDPVGWRSGLAEGLSRLLAR
jgi:enterochelin esterase family protein